MFKLYFRRENRSFIGDVTFCFAGPHTAGIQPQPTGSGAPDTVTAARDGRKRRGLADEVGTGQLLTEVEGYSVLPDAHLSGKKELPGDLYLCHLLCDMEKWGRFHTPMHSA